MPATDGAPIAIARKCITVRGVVQGVGFRPFVYRQATTLGLTGFVTNTPGGVTIEAEGAEAAVTALVEALRCTPPPSARVDAIDIATVPPIGAIGFDVRDSVTAGALSAEVPTDLATCPACLAELHDPNDRRHRYPFINCTACGPRYSIVAAMPYDRARTTMSGFTMCPACQSEYDEPADRRFHAEPNACPVCGPQLSFWDAAGATMATRDAALRAAADAIRNGEIVAVKGIGGFHLICDARDEAAVARLRQRKNRETKPFAVMAPDLREAERLCRVSGKERALLTGAIRPIVIMQRAHDELAPSVAPDNPTLGLMLPYTPLHHLLMEDLGFPVVATSGNRADNPIVIDEADAVAALGGIADRFLVHDRPIIRPVDDSVVRVVGGRPQVLRNGRGYAPRTISVPDIEAGVVAVGGHLKAAVAVSQTDRIVLGSHIGDLDGSAARTVHAAAIDDAADLYHITPTRVARDLHPDFARTRARATGGLDEIPVQHHLAHVVACMAEHSLAPPVLGIAWDGTGFGPDGTIWGGEFLTVDGNDWRRTGHLRPFRLPGGEAAVREPRRAALGLLYEAFGAAAMEMDDIPSVAAFGESERAVLARMLAQGTHAPITTSAGRLFDAFASLCGLRQVNGHEGQAACLFEWAAEGEPADRVYAFPVMDNNEGGWVVDWRPALEAAIADFRKGASPGAISAAVHAGLVEAMAAVAERAGIARVVLTGGCFQNVRLTEAAIAALGSAGFDVFWHERVPPNDGGLAVGQAVWASWMAKGA